MFRMSIAQSNSITASIFAPCRSKQAQASVCSQIDALSPNRALRSWASSSWLANGALGIGAFFIAYLLVTFVLRGGTKKLQGREPGFVDKLLGFGFGCLRGLLIASLFVVVFRAASKDGTVPGWLEETTFYPILNPVADTMMSMPFAQLKDSAQETIDKGRELDPDAAPQKDVNDDDIKR